MMTPLSSCIVHCFMLLYDLQRCLKIMKGGWLYYILHPDGFKYDTCLGSFVRPRLIFLSSSYVPLLVIAGRIFCSVSPYFPLRQSRFIPSVDTHETTYAWFMSLLLACSRTSTCVGVSPVFISLSWPLLARVRASYAWEPVFHQLINIYLLVYLTRVCVYTHTGQ